MEVNNNMATIKQFYKGLGRRKTAVASVRITENARPTFVVNDKPVDEYFQTAEQKRTAVESLDIELPTKFSVSAKVKGGGISAQAEAVRHGVARALVNYEPTLRALVKAPGFLKRDPRMVERKKPGLKKARKSPQWKKR